MDLTNFVTNKNESIKQVLLKIGLNKHGLIIGVDADNKVVGIATDGDIRRHLLLTFSLESSIDACLNRNFEFAKENDAREVLLKKFDSRVKALPILSYDGTLCGVLGRDDLPLLHEEPIYVRARAPVRISFGGGGSDLTHYFIQQAGAVINTTVTVYSHATLKKVLDKSISIWSGDLKESFFANSLDEAMAINHKNFGLILAIIKTIKPSFGFELYLHSDFPMGSGLGGSAAVAAAVLGCFNQFRQDQWSPYELAELAFQSERIYFGVSGGWQDQYATVFGGFNFIEFSRDKNIVHPLRVPRDVMLELEESLILCDSGISHNSGDIHDSQRSSMSQEGMASRVGDNVALTYEMRDRLLRGELTEFGRLIDRAWALKRQFSKKISSNHLDDLYAYAKNNGALGGKILGAGGGGFFLFYVPAFQKHRLLDALRLKNYALKEFRFDDHGLQSWRVREVESSKIRSYR
jgi:D-glycero-alpha-D-manno-heptose-7-phosphate kinase